MIKVTVRHSNELKKMLTNYIVLELIIGTLILLSLFGNESIIVHNYPKLVILGFGFAFSHLCCKMQVCTITHAEKFRQFTASTIVSCVTILAAILFVSIFKVLPVICLDIALGYGILLNTISWFSYAYRFANELAEVLGIYIFRIGKREKKEN